MTFHIFSEFNIAPVANRTIDIRNFLDSGGPHLLVGGFRTEVPDAAAVGGTVGMQWVYEFPNGETRLMAQPSIDLTTRTQVGGSIWYMQQELVIDMHYPLSNGPGSDPRGKFVLQFQGTGLFGTATYSYETVITVFDGSPSVVYHP